MVHDRHLEIVNHNLPLQEHMRNETMKQTPAYSGPCARGPDGCVLTLADLPSPDTKRWVIRRKAIVAAAVRGGLISMDVACSRYRLHPEELMLWCDYIDQYGFLALRATKIRYYVRPRQSKRVPNRK
jgi:hypothetical protein